ncbi:disease resistance protein TAO1-like [Lycium ferocissimum]|uniref:disease resistance protein TAO1-like n=1 Tax=Lycium ferocissimum TaxID=112874 RepID=UPI002815A9A2|nr:disease resistance protein TAO1-like [Lycium ferocissimum]XP_059287470.1 disease resistance protein TAO1-like [Lycium ferocissimum]XP_059287471.1 disease resistance protein TAO1-like [Lycium ferocissimum]XP_059287472.1 disease resistance protein TAO1-like [Lycium ferocissimum]XP_059287473.1 disease resistance protein TAO1-like [Lycium ferocissimum]XP_059287475.1 disease resistance protein TAO1-like [Lycium ferocissimum]XP_059287476.1 disease resistance protein TAO1-like [Lycium ferocissimu
MAELSFKFIAGLADPSRLVGLCLGGSQLVKLWPIPKKLGNLKHLDLSCSFGLTKTHNFGDMPKLETLILESCTNLEEVLPSLGHCRMLTYLDLFDCHKLKKLPELKLSNLKHLNLRGCGGLTETPNFGDMPNLETLYLWRCENLEEVHPSLGHCRMLTYLDLSDCHKLKKLPELKLGNLNNLNLSRCGGLTETPNFGDMPSLKALHLWWCKNLEEVHPSLGHCRMLIYLDLSDCHKLKKLPELKLSNLKNLNLGGCRGLTETPNFGDMPNLKTLNFGGCKNLEEVHPSLGHCRMLTHLTLSDCHKLRKLPKFATMESLDKCTSLEEFLEICGDMRRLTKLIKKSTGIRESFNRLHPLGI